MRLKMPIFVLLYLFLTTTAYGKTPYQVLGIKQTASEADAKAAYRSLAKQYHPDRNPNDPTALRKFQELGQAWDVIRDPVKRASLDRSLRQGAGQNKEAHMAKDTRTYQPQTPGFRESINEHLANWEDSNPTSEQLTEAVKVIKWFYPNGPDKSLIDILEDLRAGSSIDRSFLFASIFYMKSLGSARVDLLVESQKAKWRSMITQTQIEKYAYRGKLTEQQYAYTESQMDAKIYEMEEMLVVITEAIRRQAPAKGFFSRCAQFLRGE